MAKHNILFVTINRHQRNYFQVLGQVLQETYNVFYVHYPIVEPVNFLHRPDIPEDYVLTEEEIETISSFLVTKGKYRNFGQLRKWLHSPNYLRQKADAAMRYFYWYILKNKIDIVCVWNGTLVPLAVATTMARKLNRKTIFFENGTLPNTTTADPIGVNNCGSLAGKSASLFSEMSFSPEALSDIFQSPPSVRALKQRWYERLFKRRPPLHPEKVTLPEHFVFVPFQVHDDTQVLLHSPYIKTMFELVEYVVQAVEEYNRAKGDNLWVVCKEHPSDFRRIDYSHMKDKYAERPVLFLKYFPTPELIKQSTGIITINSSVGIEALLSHKPVFTLGNAFYNIDGIVTHVQPPEQLGQALANLDRPMNNEMIDKFLYYLRYNYLIPGSWRKPDEKHLKSVKERFDALLPANNE